MCLSKDKNLWFRPNESLSATLRLIIMALQLKYQVCSVFGNTEHKLLWLHRTASIGQHIMNKTQQDTTNVDHLLRQQAQWDQLDNQKVLARRCGYNKSSWGRALMQAAQLPREQQNLTEPTTTVALQSSAITSALLYDSDMTDLVLRQLSPDRMYCAAPVCRGFADLARSICPTVVLMLCVAALYVMLLLCVAAIGRGGMPAADWGSAIHTVWG